MMAWPCWLSLALMVMSRRTRPRHLHEVDRADIPAGLADGGGDLAQHAGLVLDLQPDREAIGGAGGDGHQSLVMAGI